MRQPLVAGNWKMNGSRESVDHLLKILKARASEVTACELAVFPSFVFLDQASAILEGSAISWGGQTISHERNGAFTGEVSASMLIDYACRYVIVGHSERRSLYGEDNAVVAAKFTAASQSGLRPILCVGETLEQRESGSTLDIIGEQLEAVLRLKDNRPSLIEAVIAYEPVWAIGTGRVATPEQVQEVHAAIRDHCRRVDTDLAEKIRILYGGSVKPENAKDIFAMPDVDGALVGGASLDADKFIEIGLCNNSF